MTMSSLPSRQFMIGGGRSTRNGGFWTFIQRYQKMSLLRGSPHVLGCFRKEDSQTSCVQGVQGELSKHYELPQARASLTTAALSGTDGHIGKAGADLTEGSQTKDAME